MRNYFKYENLLNILSSMNKIDNAERTLSNKKMKEANQKKIETFLETQNDVLNLLLTQ